MIAVNDWDTSCAMVLQRSLPVVTLRFGSAFAAGKNMKEIKTPGGCISTPKVLCSNHYEVDQGIKPSKAMSPRG